MRKISIGSSLEVELWALRDGLVLARKMGIYRIKVEVDVEAVKFLIANGNSNLHPLRVLIDDCGALLSSFQKTRLLRSHEEGNFIADKLAKRVISLTFVMEMMLLLGFILNKTVEF